MKLSTVLPGCPDSLLGDLLGIAVKESAPFSREMVRRAVPTVAALGLGGLAASMLLGGKGGPLNQDEGQISTLNGGKKDTSSLGRMAARALQSPEYAGRLGDKETYQDKDRRLQLSRRFYREGPEGFYPFQSPGSDQEETLFPQRRVGTRRSGW